MFDIFINEQCDNIYGFEYVFQEEGKSAVVIKKMRKIGDRSKEAELRRMLRGLGSSPPRCSSKCGRCTPCRPVHVAVPPGTPVTAEYYPEAWRCKCGNKLYMPWSFIYLYSHIYIIYLYIWFICRFHGYVLCLYSNINYMLKNVSRTNPHETFDDELMMLAYRVIFLAYVNIL